VDRLGPQRLIVNNNQFSATGEVVFEVLQLKRVGRWQPSPRQSGWHVAQQHGGLRVGEDTIVVDHDG
jgi:hypothetical protein